jgi:hypothetical protein
VLTSAQTLKRSREAHADFSARKERLLPAIIERRQVDKSTLMIVDAHECV